MLKTQGSIGVAFGPTSSSTVGNGADHAGNGADHAPPALYVPGWGTTSRLRKSENEILRLSDTFVIVGVLGAAFVFTNRHAIADFEHFLALRVSIKNVLLVAGFLVFWQAIYSATNLYSGRKRGRTFELVEVSVACTLAAAGAALVPLVGLSGAFGIKAVAIFWFASVPAVLLSRSAVRGLLHAVSSTTRPRQVIIIGSGPRAYAIYRSIREYPETGYSVLGFVDSNGQIEYPEIRANMLGEIGELEQLLMHRAVDLVLIALPVKSKYSRIEETIRVCERLGVESHYLADIFHGHLARHEYQMNGTVPAVAMKVVQDDARLVLKRGLDITGALIGLILAFPLMLAIGIAIRFTSTGPIFFGQERYGLNRRIFRMYKFRTMVTNAESLQFSLEHLNEAQGPVFKLRKDPRITRLGHFLRRTSLDELPQLLNVLKGDMSLVGPRPLPLRDVRRFSEGALMRRFSVLPGLTCLWQISGRSNLGFDDWIRLDLQYIDGWSIWLDLTILLRTIPAVFRGVGAA